MNKRTKITQVIILIERRKSVRLKNNYTLLILKSVFKYFVIKRPDRGKASRNAIGPRNYF
ncbi:hypothetical protein LEUCM_01810 [Leuconostoc suionicum]|jgi:hypothetical protein|nr:hypothetical protein LEUCM_01810 [Leuconostoc suionicum]GEL82335.1 hypothetical protein LME02_03640 [Leuconostoc mesenteroides subsp. dextranicum]GEL84270.1 hypothetical protein LME03_06180 [Leuconostoc mesenteroides subsp. mesenteroides]